MTGRILILLAAVALAAGAPSTLPGGQDTLTAGPAGDARAALGAKVAAIFTRSCATGGCHSGEHPKMQLDLSAAAIPASLVGVNAKQAGDLKLIDTEDPAKSYLLLKLTGGKGMRGKKMPIKAQELSAEELAAVSAWVAWFAGSGATADSAASDSAAPPSSPQIHGIEPAGRQ
jgi:mono/diheme cytochrome c family protein